MTTFPKYVQFVELQKQGDENTQPFGVFLVATKFVVLKAGGVAAGNQKVPSGEYWSLFEP